MCNADDRYVKLYVCKNTALPLNYVQKQSSMQYFPTAQNICLNIEHSTATRKRKYINFSGASDITITAE